MIDFDEILGDPEFRIYGLSIKDILKMSCWLKSQNATVKDLDDSMLKRHEYSKRKIFDAIGNEFRY